MIWVQLAMFAVSFLVTALLAPKPKIENARADTLDPNQLPRSTEDDPIPLVLGRVRLRGPNTIWYGDFFTEAMTTKVKTGLFSSKDQTTGYTYYLGIDLAICLGPHVQLLGIYIDDKRIWFGEVGILESVDVEPFSANIDKPDWFGGEGEGGGWKGQFSFFPGNYDQGVSNYVESIEGAGNVPGYRGTCHVVFNQNMIGEQASLRKMDFEVCAYTRNLTPDEDSRVDFGLEPMEAITEITVNDWRGLGQSIDTIDMDSFLECATKLKGEHNSVSLTVSAAQTGKEVIAEILRQIDGILYEDPDSGKITGRLIRNDYDPEDLPLYDADDIVSISGFSKTAWTEVYSQVKVSYSDLLTDSGKVAVAQDMAVANMIGTNRTASVSFPFCYDDQLAADLAQRELARLSVPLCKMTIEMNRRAYRVKPGDVFRISWPEYGIVEMVVRVQKLNLGDLLNNRITLEVSQDFYSATESVFAPPPATDWTDPRPEPVEVLISEVTETPFFLNKLLPNPAPNNRSDIIVFPRRPQSASTGYDVVMGVETGDLDYRDPEQVPYPVSFILDVNYPEFVGFSSGLDATGITVTEVVGTIKTATTDKIREGSGGLIYMNGEWLAYRTVTNLGSGSYRLGNVQRGILGTRPVGHLEGDYGFIFDENIAGLGEIGGALHDDGEVFYKILDRAAGSIKSQSGLSENSYSLNRLKTRPLRPRDLKLDGERTNLIVAVEAHDLTWVRANRNQAQIEFENDADAVPDLTEQYDLQVYGNGVLDAGLSDNNITSPYELDISSSGASNFEVRLFSRRVSDDLLSGYYAKLTFSVDNNNILLSGDVQTGNDKVLLSGDAQSGMDTEGL